MVHHGHLMFFRPRSPPLSRAGVHPKVVSERLGHSSVGITLDTYSHVLPGMQQDAVRLVDAALAAAIRHDKSVKE
jgi:integrase